MLWLIFDIPKLFQRTKFGMDRASLWEIFLKKKKNEIIYYNVGIQYVFTVHGAFLSIMLLLKKSSFFKLYLFKTCEKVIQSGQQLCAYCTIDTIFLGPVV